MFRALCLLCFALQFGVCLADEKADKIRQPLVTAKLNFEEDMKNARAAALQWFEKSESAARTDGNKDFVEQLAADRRALAEKGRLPNAMPNIIRSRFSKARLKLESAYLKAIKGMLQIKNDADAKIFEDELDQFRARVPDPHLPADATGWLRISNRATGRQLVVSGGAKHSGATLAMGAPFPEAAEQWRFKASGDDFYKVENSNSKTLLTWKQPMLAVIRPGAALDNEEGVKIQEWQFVPVGDTIDIYLIRNRASSLVLTAENLPSSTPEIAVGLAKASGRGTRSQHWRLIVEK